MYKISVVIPTYNRAKLAERAVFSAINQPGINRDEVEVIVVDDGSTDDTEQVIKAIDLAGLKYIRQENKGVAAARNTGITAAQGEYIAMLDSDDYLKKNSLVFRSDFLDRYPDYDVITGSILEMRDDLSLIGKEYLQKVIEADPQKQAKTNATIKLRLELTYCTDQHEFFKLFVKYYRQTGGGIPFTTTSTMLRKRAFEKAGLYNEELLNSEDLEFFYRLTKHCKIKYDFMRVFSYVNFQETGLSKSLKRGEMQNQQSQAIQMIETDIEQMGLDL